MDGLLVLPPGWERRDGPFPLVTVAHGGPYGRYADSFHLHWCLSGRWLAAGGYAVLLPNRRGGQGHGREFATRIEGNLGVGDYPDVEAGIDMLVREGVADPDRLGIGGWSHGGFLAAWAVGQTDRFKAAVMGAGISDFGALVAEHDFWHETAVEVGHTGWEGPGPHRHDELSPASYAHRARTPILILHGEKDTRVPLSQASYFAKGLSEHGCPHEFVVYPREGHDGRGGQVPQDGGGRGHGVHVAHVAGVGGVHGSDQEPPQLLEQLPLRDRGLSEDADVRGVLAFGQRVPRGRLGRERQDEVQRPAGERVHGGAVPAAGIDERGLGQS